MPPTVFVLIAIVYYCSNACIRLKMKHCYFLHVMALAAYVLAYVALLLFFIAATCSLGATADKIIHTFVIHFILPVIQTALQMQAL